jgi:hypothetical protein
VVVALGKSVIVLVTMVGLVVMEETLVARSGRSSEKQTATATARTSVVVEGVKGRLGHTGVAVSVVAALVLTSSPPLRAGF